MIIPALILLVLITLPMIIRFALIFLNMDFKTGEVKGWLNKPLAEGMARKRLTKLSLVAAGVYGALLVADLIWLVSKLNIAGTGVITIVLPTAILGTGVTWVILIIRRNMKENPPPINNPDRGSKEWGNYYNKQAEQAKTVLATGVFLGVAIVIALLVFGTLAAIFGW
jgi:hypothetical protein